VKLEKKRLLEILRTEGDHSTADAVENGLPDDIDTDRDADALSGVGLDRTQLMAKLAAAGFGTSLSP
jgi:hypothetical protein